VLSLIKSNLIVKAFLLLGLFVYSEYSQASLFCLFNWNSCHRHSPRKHRYNRNPRVIPVPPPSQNPFQPYQEPNHTPGPQGYDFYDSQRPQAPNAPAPRIPQPLPQGPKNPSVPNPPVPNPPRPNPQPGRPTPPAGNVEQALANAVRKVGGKSVQGQFDPGLCQIIKPYAEKLARQNFQDGHKGMEQRSQQAYRLGAHGASEITAESWGWEKSVQASADSCVESWLQSPGHRKAMMSPHKKYCYTMAKATRAKPNRGAPFYCVGFFAD
jgi:uncharacterized protein YkwD